MTKYNVGWGITNLCNMNCAFCYSKKVRRSEKNKCLGYFDWKKFIDENYMYIDSINYGTGENTLSDDFFKFVSYVRTNYPSITQSLTTNGYLSERISKDDKIYEIYKKSIDEVDVSLDFADKENHCLFRGQKKAYDWAIKTLEYLQNDKKKSTIVFVGFEDSVKKDNIDGIFELAKKYGSLVRFNIYRPVNKDKEINEKFKLSYSSLVKTIEYINQKYSVLSLNDSLFGNIYSKEENIYDNTGTESIRILPDGSICPSTYLITKEYSDKYNIKQDNVLSYIRFPEFINPPIPKECLNCKIADKCRGGVYDRRMLWNGTLEKRDPYCPYDNNDNIEKEKILCRKRSRISVHDGYLPTMFFSNDRRF